MENTNTNEQMQVSKTPKALPPLDATLSFQWSVGENWFPFWDPDQGVGLKAFCEYKDPDNQQYVVYSQETTVPQNPQFPLGPFWADEFTQQFIQRFNFANILRFRLTQVGTEQWNATLPPDTDLWPFWEETIEIAMGEPDLSTQRTFVLYGEAPNDSNDTVAQFTLTLAVVIILPTPPTPPTPPPEPIPTPTPPPQPPQPPVPPPTEDDDGEMMELQRIIENTNQEKLLAQESKIQAGLALMSTSAAAEIEMAYQTSMRLPGDVQSMAEIEHLVSDAPVASFGQRAAQSAEQLAARAIEFAGPSLVAAASYVVPAAIVGSAAYANYTLGSYIGSEIGEAQNEYAQAERFAAMADDTRVRGQQQQDAYQKKSNDLAASYAKDIAKLERLGIDVSDMRQANGYDLGPVQYNPKGPDPIAPNVEAEKGILQKVADVFTYIDGKLTFPGASAYTAKKGDITLVASMMEYERRRESDKPLTHGILSAYDDDTDFTYWHHILKSAVDDQDKAIIDNFILKSTAGKGLGLPENGGGGGGLLSFMAKPDGQFTHKQPIPHYQQLTGSDDWFSYPSTSISSSIYRNTIGLLGGGGYVVPPSPHKPHMDILRAVLTHNSAAPTAETLIALHDQIVGANSEHKRMQHFQPFTDALNKAAVHGFSQQSRRDALVALLKSENYIGAEVFNPLLKTIGNDRMFAPLKKIGAIGLGDVLYKAGSTVLRETPLPELAAAYANPALLKKYAAAVAVKTLKRGSSEFAEIKGKEALQSHGLDPLLYDQALDLSWDLASKYQQSLADEKTANKALPKHQAVKKTHMGHLKTAIHGVAVDRLFGDPKVAELEWSNGQQLALPAPIALPAITPQETALVKQVAAVVAEREEQKDSRRQVVPGHVIVAPPMVYRPTVGNYAVDQGSLNQRVQAKNVAAYVEREQFLQETVEDIAKLITRPARKPADSIIYPNTVTMWKVGGKRRFKRREDQFEAMLEARNEQVSNNAKAQWVRRQRFNV